MRMLPSAQKIFHELGMLKIISTFSIVKSFDLFEAELKVTLE